VNLGAVLHDTALQARRLSRARATVLFGELRLNRRRLASHGMPPARSNVYDEDGVLYRSFPGQGLRFHPLGNFSRLNGMIGRGQLRPARRLAEALQARGVKRSRRTVWEYTFSFGGGRAPWTSGMAQAVAAQTLAWGGHVLGAPSLSALARRAYRTIPRRLTMQVSAGPWVRLYSFSGLVVLNAQLQTALSVAGYAKRTGHRSAARLAARLRASAAGLLPIFDTGYWSHYSPGNESPLSYHVYVVDLLRKLWKRTGEQRWLNRAETFHRYTLEPPILRGRAGVRRLFPRPVDGFRDATTVSFWLSKPSTVTVNLPGLHRTMYLRGGKHKILWRPTGVRVGSYRPHLKAIDLAGNKAHVRFDPIEIDVDRRPPIVTAELLGRRLSWRARDWMTPWVRVSVRLDRPGRRRRVSFGVVSHRGEARLPRLDWRWRATLVVSDSSGNVSRAPLGEVGGR
jgi:D-glucuronyl C5-epimerase C-terminus